MRSALLSLAVLAAAWAAPSRARACVAINDMPVADVLPAPSSADVPTNAVIWADQTHGDVKLLDASGASQALTPGVLGGSLGPWVNTFKPAQPLKPNQTYRVVAGTNELSRFTTGAAADSESPLPPKEVGRTSRLVEGENSVFGVRTKCGASSDDRFVFTFSLDYAGVLAVAARKDSASALGRADGTVEAMTPAGGNTVELTLRPGETTNVVFGTFDTAGNFSGWSEPVAVEAPTTGLGCSTVPGNLAPMAFALLGLALRFRVRR